MRRYIYHARYVRMRQLSIQLQRVARRKVAQAKLQSLREQKAAITIQACWRRYVVRKKYLATRHFILRLQTGRLIICIDIQRTYPNQFIIAIRCHHGKRQLVVIREHAAATNIQRLVRGW